MLLFLKLNYLVYGYIGLLYFEGITNLRITRLVTMARFGKNAVQEISDGPCKMNFEAERMFRILIASMLVATFVAFPEQTWFFPWFLGFMVAVAGVTNLCPMIIVLKSIGFK